MYKQVLFVLLSSLIVQISYSQDSIFYKNKIDSILVSRSKSRVKKIKVKSENYKVRYFFKKDTKELALIEVVEQNVENILIYNYHYIDNELTMVNKYNNRPKGDKLRGNAFYYLKNKKLIYKNENNTQIDNINYHLERAQQLKETAPFY